VRSIANPVRLSRTPITYDLAAPALGEGQEEVLQGWLGLGRDEIDALAAEGAIGREG
jgi:crotonobetainyl-CoA:carnitine CoA-transferase CaiB-like acyl-CoA transferase